LGKSIIKTQISRSTFITTLFPSKWSLYNNERIRFLVLKILIRQNQIRQNQAKTCWNLKKKILINVKTKTNRNLKTKRKRKIRISKTLKIKKGKINKIKILTIAKT